MEPICEFMGRESGE